ncbi:MAG: 5'-nucleotidase C-terminal domain-containing protein [Chloroflexota bacterium]
MLRKISLLIATLAIAALGILVLNAQDEESFNLTIVHSNDTHAAHEPDGDGNGGAAIMAAVANQVRASVDNSLFLDAGDRFTGSLYHTVHLGQDQVALMNLMGYDAVVLGNHEFDNGDQVLADFVNGLTFPTLSANVDFSATELLADAPIEGSVIIDVSGTQVGIIGLTAPDSTETSNPSPEIVFNDDLVTITNTLSAELTEQGVGIIVVLSHIGINLDTEIAPQLENVDLIIGGHSHTLLANQDGGAADEYPLVFTNEATGETILYVQSGDNAEYLGRLDMEFDSAGVLQDWEGDSIFLSQYITPDAEVAALVAELAGPVEELRSQPAEVTSEIVLDGDRTVCRVEECNLGNLIADSFIWETGADIAIMNSGGIRRDLPAADLTFGDLLELQPFGNTIATLELTGADVIAALENGVSSITLNEDGQISRDGAAGRFPQVSGMRYTYDPTLEPGSRIISVEIELEDGTFAPIDEMAVYTLATPNFIANGGDGYDILVEAGMNVYLFGRVDWEVTRDYMQLLTPINDEDGISADDDTPRITALNAEVAPRAE